MRKTFVILTALTLCLCVGSFLILKATVFDRAALAGLSNASTETLSDTQPENQSDSSAQTPKGQSENPHGVKNYNSLTAEQRKQADEELVKVELAITQYLRSEVQRGLMTVKFADGVQKSIHELLIMNRSSLPESQQMQPGSNL